MNPTTGNNCTFLITRHGTVYACGEGSYGRLGQGNSDDLHTLTAISALQGCVLTLAFLIENLGSLRKAPIIGAKRNKSCRFYYLYKNNQKLISI